MTDTAPRRCPFCGECDFDPLPDDVNYAATCMRCFACGPLEATKEEAIAAWNRRTIDADVERVARAIAPKAWATYGKVGVDRLPQAARRTASLRHARAVIAAMEGK